MKSAWHITKQTISEFMEDRALRLSAAMAYYAVFSIGPLLILVVAIAGLVLGEESVREQVSGQLQGLFGKDSARMVESMMVNRSESASLVATIAGGIALLFGAAGVFGQLQDALNTIWEVKAKPGGGIWGFIRDRFLSLSMVLGLGFLLLISMVLSTVVNAMAGYLEQMLSLPQGAAQILNEGASFIVITLLFALIFKLLPDVRIGWRYVWIGALGTAALFVIGKFLLGFYLGKQSTSSAYGAGTAFVLVLLYIYYSSVILFLGAEFTQVYARYKGARIEPGKYAVPVTEEEREQEGAPREKSRPERAPAGTPATAYAMTRRAGSTPNQIMEQKPLETTAPGASVARAPLREVQSQPWSFIGLALGMGLAAGVAFRFKAVRKAFRLYALARRII